MRNDLRDAAIIELRSRLLEACLKQSQLPGGLSLDVLINDTLFHERKRLDTDRSSPTWAADVSFWDGIKSKLGRSGPAQHRQLLSAIIERFTEEVRGNFNPMVFQFATKVMPRALPVLLNAVSPKRLFRRGVPEMADTIKLQGNIEGLQRAAEQGTVILTPTHVSNLDSPVIGWALHAMGLPPFTYGAGLNLFSNPVLAYFMRNLGAYRVDRRKTAPLYKDILKEYATVSIEMGQPNLFFPAGTRVRSGHLEHKLKLGLLSSGLRAYINNVARNKENPNVYIVPCTLNYHLVLEAETLIEDHLKAAGKSRYIISDDESSNARKIAAFAQNLVNLDSGVVIHIGDPLDPFGNAVDEQGRSLDPRGRIVEIDRYVRDGSGQAIHLPQRDRAFTYEAGQAVASAFSRYTVALSTNIVALSAFELLRRRHPKLDLFRLLRIGDEGTGIKMTVLATEVRRVWEQLNELASAGKIVLADEVIAGDATEIIRDALRHFGSYHTRAVLKRRGDRVFTEDMNVLLYYSNRLRSYGLEPKPDGGQQ